jgi:hypothetical protein
MRRVIVVLAVVTAPAALLAAQAADASARSAADGLPTAAPHLARVEPAAPPPPRPPLVLTDGARSAAGVESTRSHDAAVPVGSPDLSDRRTGPAVAAAQTAGVCAGTGRPSARAPPQSG